MIKFSKIVCLAFAGSVLLGSCQKKEIGITTIASNNYTLSSLPALPVFARSIAATGEDHREFSLRLKEGTVLNFKLDGSESTMFGKRRTLLGTVENAGVKQKSVMLIAENGFCLYYQNGGHMFALKSNVSNFNFGYKELAVDLESAKSKVEIAEYSRINGNANTNALLNAYKAVKALPVQAEDHKYSVTVEKNLLYTLEDQTLTEVARQQVEGSSNIDQSGNTNNNNAAGYSVMAPAAVSVANGRYNIKCVNGNVYCGSDIIQTNGAAFEVYAANGGMGEYTDNFILTSVGDNIYTIKNELTSRLLQPASDGNSASVGIWDANNLTSQKWKIIPTGDGSSFYIISLQSGKYLTIPGATAAYFGKQITINDGNNGINQKFTFIPLADRPISYYNLEIAYIESGYNSNDQFAWLCFSLMTIDPSGKKLFWMPITSQYNPGSSLMDIVKFFAAIAYTGDINSQVNNLVAYLNVNPVPRGKCRATLYNRKWNDVAGISDETGYNNGLSLKKSFVIAGRGNGNNILAHECGHNMGASHVTDPSDVMYPGSSNSYAHKSAANISKMTMSSFNF